MLASRIVHPNTTKLYSKLETTTIARHKLWADEAARKYAQPKKQTQETANVLVRILTFTINERKEVSSRINISSMIKMRKFVL